MGLVVVKRTVISGGISPRRLNFYNVRTQVPQYLSAKMAGFIGQVKYPVSFQQ